MIPETLKIFGHNYIVRMHDDGVLGNNNLGTFLGRQTEILINRRQSKTQMESTLLHEIIEVINSHQGLGLKHKQINRLETGLYQVLKDNELGFGK